MIKNASIPSNLKGFSWKPFQYNLFTICLLVGSTAFGQDQQLKITTESNQVFISSDEDIDVPAKLVENYLNEGKNVVIQSKKNIALNASINVHSITSNKLNFICSEKGDIVFAQDAKISSKVEQLDLFFKTKGNIRIASKAVIQTNGGDIQLQAFEPTLKMKRKATSSMIIDGIIDASAVYGGKITIESDEINIGASAKVLSTGNNGGGKILIGGDWQGGTVLSKRESEVLYESIGVHVAEGALIDASAKLNGNGGKVVIWSNIEHPKSNTEVKGELLAMGGKFTGKGGMIETSGGAVDFERVKVSTIASDGSAGEWLIDPYNFYFNSTQLATLASNLNSNHITISTWSSPSNDASAVCGDGHVVFLDNFTYSGGNARTLTISSHQDIWINGNITSSGGALSLAFNASSGKRVLINGDITTNGGAIAVYNAATIHFQKTSGTQTINTNGGAIDFWNSNVKLLRHSGTLSINSGNGYLSLGGTGTVDQINTFYSFSPTLLMGWGGAHTYGIKNYNKYVTQGRTYSVRMFFWDSWDNEYGELIVDNGAINYYFAAYRTHGTTNEMNVTISNFGIQYLITGPSLIGGYTWTDMYVDITFTAQHSGWLKTFNNLDQGLTDESLELYNLWENQYSEITYSSGSRSLELISNTGQIACGTKNFSNLAALTFNTNNDWGFVEGIISGATNVTKSGTGKVRFSGLNTYSGTTTVSGGTYRFVPWFTTDMILYGSFTNNGTVTYETGAVNNRPVVYFNGAVSGSGSWNITSDVAPSTIFVNRMTFRSTTTTSGQINVTSFGNLWLEGSNINCTSPINLNGSDTRLRLYGPLNATQKTGAITGTGTVDFADGGGGKGLTLEINTGSSNAVFDGIISNSGVYVGPTVLNLAKIGTGTFTFTKNNTYTGTTAVNAGVLQIGNGAATGKLGSGAVTVATNSTLNFNLNTATSFINGFDYSATGATIANISSTTGAMITLSGGVNAGINGSSILDGGTAGVTLSGAATPYQGGAGVWIKGDVTFTGSNLNALVIKSVGIGSTMRFKTSVTPWWFGATDATYAPNVVVDAGVSVSQDNAQGAGSLFFNSLSGSGTINLAGGISALNYIYGQSSIANLNATSSIALVVGQGGSAGSITSGNITANNGITLNSTTSYVFSGVLAGTYLTKQSTNTITLTGANTYTGTSTISGGTLQIGNNGTTGSIGSGSIVNNSTLTINRSDNVTLANAISGTGIVNKLNNTTATFTANNSYSGATNITGTLVLQNNAPTSSSTTYQGTGTLQIEPSSASFSPAFSTAGWTFNSALTGLTIGKSGNTSNVTVANNTSIAGPISVYGGNITLNSNLTSTNAGSAILIKASDNISTGNTAKTISTTNGNISIIGDGDATGTGLVDLDYTTYSAGSGNILVQGETFSWTFGVGQSPTISATTGSFTFEPSDASFGQNVETGWLIFPSTLSAFTIGKSTNTQPTSFTNALTVAGPITGYGSNITINENISSSNGSTISLFANTLNFASGKTVTSSGQLILAPQTASNTIGLGDATGTLSLPAAYFSTNFADGFSNIQIGSNSQTGNIIANTFTLRDNMSLLTSGTLTLGGKPVLGVNNLTLGTGITNITSGTSNYFQTNGTGKVIRTVPTGSDLLFPVGKASYNPLKVKNNTGSQDVFSVRILDSVFLNGTSGSLITTPHVKATWDIYKTTANASSGVDFVFGWNASQEVGTFTSYKLNHYASTWSFAAGTSGTPSGTTTKTMTHTGYTGTFSPFAVSEGTFALPIELTAFNANCTENATTINWQTASEQNSAYFEVEKSRDGANWNLVETIQAAGNSTSILDYSIIDMEQMADVVYYRLNQFDQNGASKIYGPISSNCGDAVDFSANAFPNPTSGEVAIEINNAVAQKVSIQIFGTDGKAIVEGVYEIEAGTTQLPFNLETFHTGMYTLKIQGETTTELIKLLVQ